MTGRARKLRHNPTDAEARLWLHLRNRRLGGHRFRRQHPVGPYVVDFACLERGLVVEVDGSQHAEQVQYDDARTRYLESRGLTVRRYWNHDVLLDTDSVLEDLLAALNALRGRGRW